MTDPKVTSNCPRCRLCAKCRSHETSAYSNGFRSLENHEKDWTVTHELNEAGVEGFVLVGFIVLREDFFGEAGEVSGHHLEALLFKSGDDLPHKAALDGVRLEDDESLLHGQKPLCFPRNIRR